MNNKTYNFLKWTVLIALPAISACINQIGVRLEWADTELTVFILNAVTALLGSLIGVSTWNYNKGDDIDGKPK